MGFQPTIMLQKEKPVNTNSRPMHEPNYRLEEVDGDVMLFHPARTEIHHLNATAALVWQLCDGQRSIGEIILILQESYPEAKDEIPGDVAEVVKDLIQKGCLLNA
jgi:hypothetical protein